jgi:hypothetical protein
MTDSTIYTFDWKVEEHAHVVGLLVRERFQSGVWRVIRWLVVVILSLATIATLASLLLHDYSSAARLGPLVVLVGGATFWFERWTGLIRAWQVQRMDPAVRYPISHAVEESGLRIITRTAETRLDWSGLHKVRETPRLFMFYYSERIAYYLPKRVVGAEAEVAALRTLIRGWLPPHVPFQEG